MSERKLFSVYKGLQRPLVFRGFKGKFIYWGVGIILIAVFTGGIVAALINNALGGFFLVTTLVAGLFFISSKQKKGLYTKNVRKGVFVIPPNYKFYNNGKGKRSRNSVH